MKQVRAIIVAILLLLAILSAGYFFSPSTHGSRYELCGRDLEFTFVIVDSVDGAPIPNAAVHVFEDKGKMEEIQHLTTDSQGKAKILLKEQMCEDVWRSNFFGEETRSHTIVFGARYSLLIIAKKYGVSSQYWLAEYGYEDKGFSSDKPGDGRFQKIEYKIPIKPSRPSDQQVP